MNPGAYRQTITYDNGDGISFVTSVGVKTPNTAAANAITYLKNNKKFIQKSVVDYVNDTFPKHDYASTSVQNPNAEAFFSRTKNLYKKKLQHGSIIK